MYEKRMKKMDGGSNKGNESAQRKKANMGRMMYNKGGDAMPKAKPC